MLLLFLEVRQMEPRHRINKPIKSEKTVSCYFSPEPLPTPDSEGGWVCLRAIRLLWGLSLPLAADPLLRLAPASWCVFLTW